MADQNTVHSKVVSETVEAKIYRERFEAEIQRKIANAKQEQDKAAIKKALGENFNVGFLVELEGKTNGQLPPGMICRVAQSHELKLPPECDKYLKPSSKK